MPRCSIKPLSLETTRSLNRLLPNIEDRFAGRMAPGEWDAFAEQLHRHFPDLFRLLLGLYGGRYDFFYHLEQTVALAAQSWIDRPADLKALDEARRRPALVPVRNDAGRRLLCGFVRRGPDGLFDKIPYFRELGLTYLHLMPLFGAPEGENDGGYAVSDYRQVEPSLGTMADLQRLAQALRDEGISLVLDFVFNHTSDEHRWAQKERAGDPDYVDYYFLFPDRQTPDAYDQTLRRSSRRRKTAASPIAPRSTAGCGRRSTASSGI